MASGIKQHLEENLCDLHERIQSGQYMAPPVKRTWLDKGDGRTRPEQFDPIILAAFQDCTETFREIYATHADREPVNGTVKL